MWGCGGVAEPPATPLHQISKRVYKPAAVGGQNFFKKNMLQIRTFVIPISDAGESAEEMNRFLRSHKVMEISHQLVNNEHGAMWCFCVKYIESVVFSPAAHFSGNKIDYKQALSPEVFQIFSRLRELRKVIAFEENIPAYAVFTDEELASLAKLPEITVQSMRSVKGVGDKKVERFAEKIITGLQEKEKQQHEKSG